MSDDNNCGGERRLSTKIYNYENLITPDEFSDCDVHLFNRLVQTTNSLLYDGSYSVCSTPDSFTDSHDRHLSLQNLCDYSLEKKTDSNLSCEDCNIIEELLPYSTHLSLSEVQQKSLSNSKIKVKNTHRYDEFLALNTDEQTDVESCEKCSESEFIEDGCNTTNENEMNMFCKEIDKLIDPYSETSNLVPMKTANNNPDNFSISNSVSDASTSCFSASDCRQSYESEITSEETSCTSSKHDGNYFSSKNLSRYEIMKQRKLAKDQRKYHNSVESSMIREPNNLKSIEQIVSFIEGKDLITSKKNGYGTDHSSRKCNRSLSRGKKLGKKKKKDRSLNILETNSNSTTSEPTSHLPSEQFTSSKSSSFDNDASLPCHSLEAEEFNVESNDACKLMLEDETFIRWCDTNAHSNDPPDLIEEDRPKFYGTCDQRLNRNSNSNARVDILRETERNNVKDAVTMESESSRCNANGFPEIMPDVINDNPSTSKLNQCNNNDLAKKTHINSTSVSKFQNIDLMERSTEDDEKLTEFSYSSNSSWDDLSSKESEMDEFFKVKKKKNIKVHERTPRSLRAKLFTETKRMYSKPEIILKHSLTHDENGIDSDAKDSDCLTANLPVESQLDNQILADQTEHRLVSYEESISDEHLKSKVLTDKFHDVNCLSYVFNDEKVFFDTRYLHKFEKPVCIGSSDISFIFEEHPNTKIFKKLTECRTNQNSEAIISEFAPKSYLGETNNCMAEDVSVSCFSEDSLNVSERDKSSKCTISAIKNCSVQPNMIMLPKREYPCSDDLMLSVPFLPYSAPLFNTYPVGFSPLSERHADQNQITSQDSEQFLGNSSFPTQPPLPVISSIYVPYNCYLAVMPSSNLEALFLADQPDLDFCEPACNSNDDDLSQNYSDFTFHHRLNAEIISPSIEESHLIRDLSNEENPAVLSSAHIQTTDNTYSNVHKFPPEKFHAYNSSLSSKEDMSQVLTSNDTERKRISSEDLFNDRQFLKDDHNLNRMPFQTSLQPNTKRGFCKNNFNWIGKRNHQYNKYNLELQGRTDREGIRKNEIFYHGDGNRSSMPENCINQRSNSAGSYKKMSLPKSSFNLESAQHYLFDLFKASKV